MNESALAAECPHYSPQPPQNCCAIGRELFPMQRSLLSLPACQRQCLACRDEHLRAAVLLPSESGLGLNLRRLWITEPRLQPLQPWISFHPLNLEISIHTEAPEVQNKCILVHSPAKEKPNQKLARLWHWNPQLLLFHVSKCWPYSCLFT